jgi:hypothetical protein
VGMIEGRIRFNEKPVIFLRNIIYNCDTMALFKITHVRYNLQTTDWKAFG